MSHVSVLAAVEHLLVEEKEKLAVPYLSATNWIRVLSFVDPWTLVRSVSCVSKGFQQLFRIRMQSLELQHAFHMSTQLATDSTFCCCACYDPSTSLLHPAASQG